LIRPPPEPKRKAWNRWGKKGPKPIRKKQKPKGAPRKAEGQIPGQTRIAFDQTNTNTSSGNTPGIHLISEVKAAAARKKQDNQNTARAKRLTERRKNNMRNNSTGTPDENNWAQLFQEGKAKSSDEAQETLREPVARAGQSKRKRDIEDQEHPENRTRVPNKKQKTRCNSDTEDEAEITNRGKEKEDEPRNTRVSEVNRGIVPKGIG
jgi:hypothetical protein